MRCDDERIPGWVLVLAALALLLALAIGVTTTAHANPASTNVFLGRGATPVSFRSKTTSAGSTTVAVPAGAAVGDIAVVSIAQPRDNPTLTSGGGAWSPVSIHAGGTSCGGAECVNLVFWKKLAVGDLSGSWTLSFSTSYQAFDYIGNGATTVTLRETESLFGGTSLPFTGYTPNYSTRGALSIVWTGSAGSPTAPTNFTSRDTGTYGSGTAYNQSSGADLLNYQSGALTWTGLLNAVGGYGGLLEFSGP